MIKQNKWNLVKGTEFKDDEQIMQKGSLEEILQYFTAYHSLRLGDGYDSLTLVEVDQDSFPTGDFFNVYEKVK